MSTLLEQALQTSPRQSKPGAAINDEHIDLALAWLENRISLSQVVAVLYPGRSAQAAGTASYSRLAIILREAKRRGRITINQNNGPAERRA